MDTKEITELLDWYQGEAKRTCPDLGSEAINLSHMVLGVCSEYAELLEAQDKEDFINWQEEVCDEKWYVANYCTFRGYKLSELYLEAIEFWKSNPVAVSKIKVTNYFYCLSNLQDIVKKNLAYGKPIDCEKEKDCLVSLLVSAAIFYFDGFDLDRGLNNNIGKLRLRFPDKFDTEKALNRDLEAERKELEK